MILTREQQADLDRALEKEFVNLPTIGLIGVSGVGKSSTINTMFKTALPISHTIACTKEFALIPLEVDPNRGPIIGSPVKLVVCDAPGLGEDYRNDPHYIDMYHEWLPKCDVILWIMTARNRAIALDQQYLTHFQKHFDRIVFGLNQVDLIDPLNWPPESPIPSVEQAKNIEEIIADRQEKMEAVVARPVKIIPYSNHRFYNLAELFLETIKACPKERAWIFGAIGNYRYEDFVEARRQQSIADGRAFARKILQRNNFEEQPLNAEEIARLKQAIQQ